MDILINKSFFSTKTIGTPYDKWFSLIKSLSNNFCNCFFNFSNSVGVILKGAFKISIVLGANSMLNSTFLSSANLGRLLRKTFRNSYTTKVSFTLRIVLSYLFIICIKYVKHSLLSILLALTLLIIMLRTQPSKKLNCSPLSRLNQIFFFLKSIFAPYLPKKSIPSIISKSGISITIRSTTIL